MGETYLVVIAGGSGTRFWPRSTSRRPKQFLSVSEGERTLFQGTLDRFEGRISADRTYVVTTEKLQSLVGEGTEPGIHILAEPQGRNTAPCVFWAAQEIYQRDPDATLLILPSDHYIADLPAFLSTIDHAVHWAQAHDDLVTLGIAPTRPETGYGYLKCGAGGRESSQPRKVEAFVEKPNIEKAQQYVDSGKYFWNGGMFVWRAKVILKAFDQWMPEMSRIWKESRGDVSVAYPQLTATSIDYGLMEKAQNVVTFPLDCGWDDLGSWTSLENIQTLDKLRQGQGNLVLEGKLMDIDSSQNTVSTPGWTVALLGVDHLVVASVADVILVAHKDKAQDIKKMVDLVKVSRPDLV